MKQRGKWLNGLIASAAILSSAAIGPNANAFSPQLDKQIFHSGSMHLVADTVHGPASRVQARIADLHAKLHITAEQDPQFKIMADVMSANADALQALLERRAQDKEKSAVASMRWYERLVDAHSDALKKFVPAFEQLYASLSGEQKKAADEMFARFGGRPRPSHRHHHHNRSE
jgi:LTXXQ motif family protein